MDLKPFLLFHSFTKVDVLEVNIVKIDVFTFGFLEAEEGLLVGWEEDGAAEEVHAVLRDGLLGLGDGFGVLGGFVLLF